MSLTILKALPEAGPAWRGGSLIGPVDHELLAATLSAPGYQRAAQPVAPITLDEILGENGLNEVDLLKLDCEGCESSVLGCADPDLLRRIRFITSEYHGCPVSTQSFARSCRKRTRCAWREARNSAPL
jgi:hypothetical protein